MMKYFSFVIFSTLFVKVLCQNIFSFVNEPQKRASPEFATLGSTSLALKLSNLERMSDFLMNDLLERKCTSKFL